MVLKPKARCIRSLFLKFFSDFWLLSAATKETRCIQFRLLDLFSLLAVTEIQRWPFFIDVWPLSRWTAYQITGNLQLLTYVYQPGPCGCLFTTGNDIAPHIHPSCPALYYQAPAAVRRPQTWKLNHSFALCVVLAHFNAAFMHPLRFRREQKWRCQSWSICWNVF